MFSHSLKSIFCFFFLSLSHSLNEPESAFHSKIDGADAHTIQNTMKHYNNFSSSSCLNREKREKFNLFFSFCIPFNCVGFSDIIFCFFFSTFESKQYHNTSNEIMKESKLNVKLLFNVNYVANIYNYASHIVTKGEKESRKKCVK